ncbi:MAG: Asp-tRNA(Asn)/Glu-tRNA(Gln) amidotransferase subunit GatB, partial [Candidatus Saccharimonadales bacterium]
TFSQRSKENADDYRYMPDPDIPPIVLDEDYISKIKTEMPMMPDEIRGKLSEIGIDNRVIEDLLDNRDVLDEVLLALEKASPADARNVAFYGLQSKNDEKVVAAADEDFDLEKRVNLLTTISGMQQEGLLNSSAAQEIAFQVRMNTDPEKINALIESKKQVSDEGEIAKIVEQVLSDNAKAAEDVKNGEMKAIGFLVGQVMKLSQGKANPQLAQDLIRKQLGI